jgi:hypothetical protein
MKVVALLLVAMTIRLNADAPLLQNPVSATFKYRSGITVTLGQGADALEELTISSGKMTAKIPAGEMVDIFAPWLNEVQFTEDLEFETEKGRMSVTLKYDLRPYEWGNDFSEVTFTFVEGEYHHRSTKVPIGKGLRKNLHKRKGQPEEEFGKSGVVEGVSESK